jgi:hypothetical protein
MENIKLTSSDATESNTIVFTEDKGITPILKLCQNGDIFVKGKLIENDKEVVDALREFLKFQGVVGQSEQFYCDGQENNNDRCESQCLGCAGMEEINSQ